VRGLFTHAAHLCTCTTSTREENAHTRELRPYLRAAFTTGCTFSPSSVTMMNWIVYNRRRRSKSRRTG
jgi:hypothetical protein